MNIELKEITIRELTAGYVDNQEDGVGHGGNWTYVLPTRVCYKDHQRDAVIHTVSKGFPLNVMYWAVREDGNFEIIDGQQRTVSICQFVNKEFSKLWRYSSTKKVQ